MWPEVRIEISYFPALQETGVFITCFIPDKVQVEVEDPEQIVGNIMTRIGLALGEFVTKQKKDL